MLGNCTVEWLAFEIGDWPIDVDAQEAGPSGPGPSHALRHTCAQHLLDGGAEVRQVQAVLGHHSVTTTEGYLRREPAGLRAAMEGRTYLAAS